MLLFQDERELEHTHKDCNCAGLTVFGVCTVSPREGDEFAGCSAMELGVGWPLAKKIYARNSFFFFFLNDLFDVYRLLRFVVSLKSRVFLLFFLHGSVIFWQHELPV